MKIRKSAVLQYVLIYIMLLVPGSCFFNKYLTGNIKYYVIIAMYCAFAICRRKYRLNYTILFSILLTAFVVFTRIYTDGGTGITALCQFLVCIMVTQMAICSERKLFLRRWISAVEFLAVISIVFWAVFCVFPDLVDVWPVATFDTQTMGTAGYEQDWHGKGLFLYSYLEIHPTRNCGIYTEPGVYQIVLNSTLFVLLFWKNRIGFENEIKYKRALGIIILALITCQSTTGYLGMILNVMFFLFSQQSDTKALKTKRYILGIILLAIVAIVFDFSNRGNESVLYVQVIEKLFGTSGKVLDISEGTGQYRLGTIIVSITSVIQHPLGVGYDRFNQLKDLYADGLVAASVASFAAVYGIIPWMISMYMVFWPVFKYEKILTRVLFIILFFNTTLAQTDLFYPALMMIPVYYVIQNKYKGLGEEIAL